MDEYVEKLWNLLKDKSREHGIGAVGLKKVDFNTGIEKFTKEYNNYLVHSEGDPPTRINVYNDISYAIEELKNSKIIFHHRSCQSSKETQNNSAICIHYYSANNENSALAITGLNYISPLINSLPKN